jgi:hypothetical protein
MKTTSRLFALGVAAALGFVAADAKADLEFSASVAIHAKADFDAPLTSCGMWVKAGSYGRCWRPAGVVVGWRPYGDGYWVWTDCGWYWASDEPWAWACYHYGYWIYDSNYGWVWIPDTVWAPAWVSWRIGGGCVGWAPNPPPGRFFSRRAPDSTFVFVNAEHFGDPVRPAILIVNSPGIIKHTKFISDERRVSKDFDGTGVRVAVVNAGPGLEVMEKTSGRQFKTVAIGQAVHRTRTPPAFMRDPDQPGKTQIKPEPKPGGASYQQPGPPPGHPRKGAPAGGEPRKSAGKEHGNDDNPDDRSGQGSGGDGGRGHGRGF